jgi:ribose transport system permease protein
MNSIAPKASPMRSPARPLRQSLQRHHGLLIAVAVFIAMLATVEFIGIGSLSYYDLSSIAGSGATLAVAALGQTLVVLSGGFDLSAGAVVSLVNVVVATGFRDSTLHPAWIVAASVGVGMAAGMFNGFFIAVLRMQPIVVTLSTMFILQGVTLLIMDRPGGGVPPQLSALLTGDAVPDLLPMPVLTIGIVLLLWAWLKNSRTGVAIYAIGSDIDAAGAAGVPARRVQFIVYTLAGACYGLAGAVISAQTGSADPLIGNPMLLQIFAAVVVGGTVLGGGRGGLLGTVFGAYTLMLVVNALLVLNVSAYFSTIAEGAILLAAVLAGSLGAESPLRENLLALARWWRARGNGTLAAQRRGPEQPGIRMAAVTGTGTAVNAGLFTRHAEALRFGLPAWLGLVLVVLATQWIVGGALGSWGYFNSVLVLASFLVVLALGQGAVILTGGLDLSIPWTITLCGVMLAGLVKGSDAALLYALPLTLAVGLLIGLLNGLGIVLLGLSPIVMTMAMNGILQGATLLYSNGTPDGFASPLLRAFMTDTSLGVAPVVAFMLVFVLLAVLLLGRTPFGRRIYAIGNGTRVAMLSGVRVGPVTVGVYMLSGLCGALAAVLLTGLSGQASLGMGDEYLLPSIAVVVIGGTLITGGRGHYLGMLGGVLLLTALQTLLAGTTLPHAARSILFGVVVLVAVIGLRERRA